MVEILFPDGVTRAMVASLVGTEVALRVCALERVEMEHGIHWIWVDGAVRYTDAGVQLLIEKLALDEDTQQAAETLRLWTQGLRAKVEENTQRERVAQEAARQTYWWQD